MLLEIFPLGREKHDELHDVKFNNISFWHVLIVCKMEIQDGPGWVVYHPFFPPPTLSIHLQWCHFSQEQAISHRPEQAGIPPTPSTAP